MKATRVDSPGRAFTLSILLLLPSLACAQWDFNRIETLTDEANKLKEQGLFSSAYALYPTIMHQMRISEGLSSVKQLPYLFEMAAWHENKREFEEADGLLSRAEFYADRNPNPLNHFRLLVRQRIYNPDEQSCFKRVDNRFLNPSKDCEQERYYRAESFIAATELMQKVVEISDDRRTDLRILAKLAEFTAYSVYGVDGPSVVIESRGGSIYTVENNLVRERYRSQKWSKIRQNVLAQLEVEFE